MLRSFKACGARGEVYIAEADGVPEYSGTITSEKRLVAVKFLCHDATLKEREEFERDVRILAALSSPYLARVLGACRTPPLAVVLEYLELGDLNCLIGKSYQVKISDFGTDNEAYACDYHKAEGRIPLPLRWAAWESVLRGEYSTRSDVWAYAVTLHELFTLCRRRPYDHLTDTENLSHLQAAASEELFECIARPAGCPRDLYELMLACWRRDDLQRPSFGDIHLFLQRRSLDYGT
ncbi:Tyrosine kinase-like protein [Operophtera brumata]|uniref:Tyrosine kinase-like protein n=1 Tax=Operophtera brumata TaxID=104452 RepID=A0A0L7L6G9_OPEBR|nr:Tyrosine kinase-like protein [Operophtera brumata]